MGNMAGKPLAVRLNVRNARTAAGLKEAIASAPGFFISSNGTPDCDILIAEIEDAGDDMFLQIERIRAQGQVQEIFITSLRKDPEILLRALKAGVREFFPQPLNKAEVVAALEKLKATATAAAGEARQKNGTVISVIGSRGGVGATTAAVNLAVFLQVSAPGKTVALMDMNPLGAAHLFLDIRAEFSWTAALQDIERMDSTYLFNVLSRHRSGIHVLPAPVKPAGHEAASPEALEKLVGLMRAAFDIIVMDNSKVMDHLTIRLLALSNTILVVSELNILSLVNARKLLARFRRPGDLLWEGHQDRDEPLREKIDGVPGGSRTDPGKEDRLSDPERLRNHHGGAERGKNTARTCGQVSRGGAVSIAFRSAVEQGSRPEGAVGSFEPDVKLQEPGAAVPEARPRSEVMSKKINNRIFLTRRHNECRATNRNCYCQEVRPCCI